MSLTVLRGRMTDATEFRRTAPEILDGRGDARRRKDRILEDLRHKKRSFWQYVKNDRQNDRLQSSILTL